MSRNTGDGFSYALFKFGDSIYNFRQDRTVKDSSLLKIPPEIL